MMMTVVIIYGVCWLPLHTITLLGEYKASIYQFKYIQVLWNLCHWLAMSNSCYNPLVYCWMNVRFRAAFARLFKCCPCVSNTGAMLEAARLEENKVRWNYTCVYTMNLRNRGTGQQFMQNGVHRCCVAQSSSNKRVAECNEDARQNTSSGSCSSTRFQKDQVVIPLHQMLPQRKKSGRGNKS